jgi:multidrug efflux system membrane fusion protein
MKKIGIILVVVVIALKFSACKKAESAPVPPKPVKAASVANYTTTGGAESRYSATIKADSQVDLAFKIDGYVEHLGGGTRAYGAGDYVQKGDVLAIVRQSDYRTRVEQAQTQTNEVRASLPTAQSQLLEVRSAVQTAQAQLAEAQKGIEIVHSQIEQAQAAFDKDKKDWERAQNLYAKESLTKADYDAAKARYETSLANLNGAKAQLKSAEARVQTAREQIKQYQAKIGTAEGQIDQIRAKILSAEAVTKGAQIPLADTVLRAPVSGVVIERKIEIGSLVNAGTVAFTIAQIGAVKAVFGIPDTELKELRVGQTMSVRSEALPDDEFPAKITRISPSADANSRVFEVEATINNYNGALKPNMVVSLQTPGGNAQSEVPVIPLSAVTRSKLNPDAYAVFLIEGTGDAQIARERIVTLGETYGNLVAVSSGLKIDDQVITTGATLVADGDRIQVTP